MSLTVVKMKTEVESVVLAMEHINGRRPKDRLEFFLWLTEFDDTSRHYAERLEKEIGVKEFEHFLHGFDSQHSKLIH